MLLPDIGAKAVEGGYQSPKGAAEVGLVIQLFF